MKFTGMHRNIQTTLFLPGLEIKSYKLQASPHSCQIFIFFLPLIEEHKDNTRYLFHSVARQRKSHASADSCIPAIYSRDDSINFFDTKILKIGRQNKIFSLPLPPAGLSTVSEKYPFRPAICLDSFTTIEFN